MCNVVFTPEAEDDLEEITRYIALDNPPAALRWLDEMEGVCRLLFEQPGIGQRMHTKRFGEVRRHTTGSYLIYYQPIADGIVILRVLHGARDQQRLV
jgi:toxin ParE1/3/4